MNAEMKVNFIKYIPDYRKIKAYTYLMSFTYFMVQQSGVHHFIRVIFQSLFREMTAT